MEKPDLLILLFGCSLSINGFFATYFLSGIKQQMKKLGRDISDTRDMQIEHKERLIIHEHRIISLEADLKDLPCKNNRECH